MINPKTKKGFTLIELLIGITIFVVFMGVVAQSYISIVRSFRQQNEIRKVYGEVRDFMDFLAEEARLSAVDYSCFDSGVSSCIEQGLSLNQGFTDTIVLRNKNGLEQTVISFDENVTVQKWERESGTWILQEGYTQAIQYFSENVNVTHLSFNVFPAVNPYSGDFEIYANNGTQFQPKITVFLSIENEEDSVGVPFSYDFQTTISSRVYSERI